MRQLFTSKGINMQNTNCSVMCYGKHSNTFLPWGAVTPGGSLIPRNNRNHLSKTPAK